MIITGNCKTCGYSSIQSTVCSIDKALANIGHNTLLKDTYYLERRNYSKEVKLLTRYKQILSKKLFDNNYTSYNTDSIISKVKKVIYGM